MKPKFENYISGCFSKDKHARAEFHADLESYKTRQSEAVNKVYQLLKNRQINPSGNFDSAGRFYAKNADLISVRSPSRNYRYSQMTACRTKKYVQKVAEKFEIDNADILISFV